MASANRDLFHSRNFYHNFLLTIFILLVFPSFIKSNVTRKIIITFKEGKKTLPSFMKMFHKASGNLNNSIESLTELIRKMVVILLDIKAIIL